MRPMLRTRRREVYTQPADQWWSIGTIASVVSDLCVSIPHASDEGEEKHGELSNKMKHLWTDSLVFDRHVESCMYVRNSRKSLTRGCIPIHRLVLTTTFE